MRQQIDEKMKGFADFGGKIENSETDYEIASRECAEESNFMFSREDVLLMCKTASRFYN